MKEKYSEDDINDDVAPLKVEGPFCSSERLGLLFLVFVAYFNNGADSLVTLTSQYFAKDVLLLSPALTQIVLGSASWPWLPKFLYGFCTDTIPINRYRRKPYLLLVCGIAAISYATIGCFVTESATLTALLVTSQFGVAFNDVIVDGLVVESSQGKSKALATHFQTLCVVGNSIGVMVTSFIGGYLIENIGPQDTFFILAFFPLLIMFCVCFIDERPTNIQIHCDTVKLQTSRLWSALKQPKIWKPCLFIFLMFGAPNADQGFFFFVTNGLKIEPTFIGLVTAATGVAGLIGALIFNLCLQDVSFKKMFFFVSIAVSAMGLLQLILIFRLNVSVGISDKVFLISTKTAAFIGRNLLRLTVFVFAARVCPKDIEGTLFATIMGVWNFATLLSDYIGALILSGLGVTENNFNNLWIAVVISRVTFILPLLFLKWLPSNLEVPGDTDENAGKSDDEVVLDDDSVQLIDISGIPPPEIVPVLHDHTG